MVGRCCAILRFSGFLVLLCVCVCVCVCAAMYVNTLCYIEVLLFIILMLWKDSIGNIVAVAVAVAVAIVVQSKSSNLAVQELSEGHILKCNVPTNILDSTTINCSIYSRLFHISIRVP